MIKPEALIRKTLHSIYPIHFRIAKKPLDIENFHKRLFLEVVESLQKIEDRRYMLMDTIGIDVTGFEDEYFKIIENLLNITFNKEQLRLIHSYLLSQAIKKSFNKNVNRVWLHTCSLDHKNALNNYIARGMKIFKSEIVKI